MRTAACSSNFEDVLSCKCRTELELPTTSDTSLNEPYRNRYFSDPDRWRKLARRSKSLKAKSILSRKRLDANPHRMANAFFFLFLVLGHSVRVGVPFVTGCQPSQNGRCHFLFPVSGVVPFWRVGVPFFTGRQPSHNGHCHFFPDSVASRFLRDASPHRMARAFFFSTVSGVVPFCEGWRPFFCGTRTLAEWPAPIFFLSAHV